MKGRTRAKPTATHPYRRRTFLHGQKSKISNLPCTVKREAAAMKQQKYSKTALQCYTVCAWAGQSAEKSEHACACKI